MLDTFPKSCYLYHFSTLAVKLHLPSFSPGTHDVAEELRADELELDPSQFAKPILVEIHLDRHDPYFELKVRLTTTAFAECDRCLSLADVRISLENPLLYVIGQPPSGDQVDDDDIAYVRAGTTEIDLTKDLRDFLILAYSGRHLCSEHCLGLCQKCGANLNDGPCVC